MFQPHPTIEPILIPPSLIQKGHSQEQLATALIAHLDKIRVATRQHSVHTNFQLSSRAKDLPIPNTDNTVKNVAAYFHDRFGMDRHVTITGQVLQSNDSFRLIVVIQRRKALQLEIGSADSIDSLLRAGALAILSELDTYSYLRYRYEQILICPEEPGLRTAYSDYVSEVISDSASDSDIKGAALTLLGNILSNEGQEQHAVEKYKQAIDEFDSEWAYAAWEDYY